MGLIEIHSHLLPFVDDGVGSKDQCIAVLNAYKQAGFDRIVVTPHLYNPYVSTRTNNIRTMYQWAQQEAAKLGIQLYLGSEIYIGSIHVEHVLPFMDYFVLVELDYYTEPLFLQNYNYTLLKRGYHVIVAHVERYQWFSPKNPLAKQLKDMGVLFQCNVDGIESGTASKWMNSGLIDAIAGDNHGDTRVPEKLATLLHRYPDISAKMDAMFIDRETIQ